MHGDLAVSAEHDLEFLQSITQVRSHVIGILFFAALQGTAHVLHDVLRVLVVLHGESEGVIGVIGHVHGQFFLRNVRSPREHALSGVIHSEGIGTLPRVTAVTCHKLFVQNGEQCRIADIAWLDEIFRLRQQLVFEFLSRGQPVSRE